jgi:polar amino acid transport system substrate-binding protein
MPFVFTDPSGAFIGFDMDIVKEMAKALGVKLTPVHTVWDNIFSALNAKSFDILIGGITITQKRNLMVNFADPYMIIGQTILLNKKHEGRVTSYHDLNDSGYIVTSKSGTTGEQTVKKLIPKATYKPFDVETDAVLEVLHDRADATVFDLPFCATVMARQGVDKLVFLDQPFTYEPLAWGIRKGDPDFLNWLNNFLRQLKNDGRYEKIYNKWFKSAELILAQP